MHSPWLKSASLSARISDNRRSLGVSDDRSDFSMVELNSSRALDSEMSKSAQDQVHREESIADFSPTQARDPPNANGAVAETGYQTSGRTRSESTVDSLDVFAVVVSLLALALAIATISPSLSWAAQLQYTNQIIVIGFLLGIMNMAMLRTIPYLFLVLEQRLGPSYLQNYDGLLRWSPWSSQLSPVWRLSITSLWLLPLGLSVLYKRFTGGIGTQHLSSISANFSMSALPGLQNMSGVVVLANATAPFISAMQYSAVPDYTDYSNQAYGWNLLVISNESAAALDVPAPDVISRLQAEIHHDEAYLLETTVRATVAKFNNSFDNSDRNFQNFWTNYGAKTPFKYRNSWDGANFGMLNIGTPTFGLDNSWVFIGNFWADTSSNNTKSLLRAFLSTAVMLNIRRHECKARFKISHSSVSLQSGSCSTDPLPYQWQYYEETQLTMSTWFLDIFEQLLGRPFDGDTASAIKPGWKSPAYATILASAFQSRIAMVGGVFPMIFNSDIMTYWYTHKDLEEGPIVSSDTTLNETYVVPKNRLSKTGPTLRAEASLYFIMAILPAMTIVAFLIPLGMAYVSKSNSGTPQLLPRRFNLVAVLAGMDRDSLNVFSAKHPDEADNNVTLTGKTKQEITLDLRRRSMDSHHESNDVYAGGSPQGLRYVLGYQSARQTRENKSSRKWPLRRRPGLRSTVSSSSNAGLLRPSSPIA